MEKSALMNMRKRGISECVDHFRIGDKVLPWVSTYKSLGCLVDDSLNCPNMVEHRVEMGSWHWVLGCGGVMSQSAR